MIVDLVNSWDDVKHLEFSVAKATLTCHANCEKMYQSDYEASDTVEKVIEYGHESTLEHMFLQFDIQFI
ncbi:MAG: FAD-dependent thymidylate synthase, partial [Synergistaceae bacterium]|nr:FAD-dependent thymidylate synthase [Synergistaceae bacterium]